MIHKAAQSLWFPPKKARRAAGTRSGHLLVLPKCDSPNRSRSSEVQSAKETKDHKRKKMAVNIHRKPQFFRSVGAGLLGAKHHSDMELLKPSIPALGGLIFWSSQRNQDPLTPEASEESPSYCRATKIRPNIFPGPKSLKRIYSHSETGILQQLLVFSRIEQCSKRRSSCRVQQFCDCERCPQMEAADLPSTD